MNGASQRNLNRLFMRSSYSSTGSGRTDLNNNFIFFFPFALSSSKGFYERINRNWLHCVNTHKPDSVLWNLCAKHHNDNHLSMRHTRARGMNTRNAHLFCLAPSGVCPIYGLLHISVRSYRTFSPLPYNILLYGGFISVALSVSFCKLPRVEPKFSPGTVFIWSPDFPLICRCIQAIVLAFTF